MYDKNDKRIRCPHYRCLEKVLTYKYYKIRQKHAILDDRSAPLIFGTEPHFGLLLNIKKKIY